MECNPAAGSVLSCTLFATCYDSPKPGHILSPDPPPLLPFSVPSRPYFSVQWRNPACSLHTFFMHWSKNTINNSLRTTLQSARVHIFMWFRTGSILPQSHKNTNNRRFDVWNSLPNICFVCYLVLPAIKFGTIWFALTASCMRGPCCMRINSSMLQSCRQ